VLGVDGGRAVPVAVAAARCQAAGGGSPAAVRGGGCDAFELPVAAAGPRVGRDAGWGAGRGGEVGG